MWNSRNLDPPPINTFKTKSPLIDINAVASVLNEAIKVLNNPKSLQSEAVFLSRCVYRMKLKFRNDKGFKLMEKTMKILKQHLDIDIRSDLIRFLNSIPKRYEKDFYLPTKQMVEYILVRLQGYAKVLSRLVENARETAIYMNYRLRLGHFWTTAAVVLAVISRIWVIAKFLTEKCCSWYHDLFPLRDKLELNGRPWLQDDYTFPNSLVEWLDMEWLFQEPEVSKIQLDLPILSLLDETDDEVEFCYQYKLNDCYVIDDSDDDVQILNYNKTKSRMDIDGKSSDLEIIDDNEVETSIICDDSDDIGEKISRKEIKKVNKQKQKQNTNNISLINEESQNLAKSTRNKKKKKKLNETVASPPHSPSPIQNSIQPKFSIGLQNINVPKPKIKKKKKKKITAEKIKTQNQEKIIDKISEKKMMLKLKWKEKMKKKRLAAKKKLSTL